MLIARGLTRHFVVCVSGSECALSNLGVDGVNADVWCSKHMDKHDRPYRCENCPALEGFTYFGGLRRHQREVHGVGAEEKQQFLCPHDGCPRSEGTPFQRRGNLNEHLRRVHHDSPDQIGIDVLTDVTTDKLSTPKLSSRHSSLNTSFIDTSSEKEDGEVIFSLGKEVMRLTALTREQFEALRDLKSRVEALEDR